jgi:sigma-B regulation protein RsbU (phosphoserine phosphatase)
MKPEIASMIGQVPLFAGLRGTELSFVASLLDQVQIPAGTLLFREGDPGDHFYLIVDGEAEVIKSLGTPDERSIAIRKAGEFFGEMSLFESDGRRMASVMARSPLCMLRMARKDFDVLLQRRPALAHEMLRVLSLRLTHTHETTIADLREKNRQLAEAYEELKAAQAQIVEKERLEKELETARWIQQSILPRSLPSRPGFDFGALLTPARAVGGDLFDFIPLAGDRIGVVIGDVSDKGVPAAIFMALTYSLLRAEAARWPSPARVLKATNHHLIGMNSAGMFVTVLYGVLDPRDGQFVYARAGHELPLHLGPAGELIATPQGVGQPLGLLKDPLLDEQCIRLEPGAVLLLYTDGATDVMDPRGERFGLERLRAAAQANRDESPQAFCDRLWTVFSGYQDGSAQFDDVALVAIRAEA